MRYFYHHSTYYLGELLATLEQGGPGWKCIHLTPSQDAREHIGWRLMQRQLIDTLNVEEGYIFVCDSGETLVLFSGRAMPILQKIQWLMEVYDVGRVDLKAYDLKVHGETIRQMGNKFGSIYNQPAASGDQASKVH